MTNGYTMVFARDENEHQRGVAMMISLGEGQSKMSTDRRGGPAGLKQGAWHKTGLIGEQELKPYAPHDVEKTTF